MKEDIEMSKPKTYANKVGSLLNNVGPKTTSI